MPTKSKLILYIIAHLFLLLIPNLAFAYIGPGLGVGAMIALVIVLVSVLLALYALVWFPMKRRMKAKRQEKVAENNQAEWSLVSIKIEYYLIDKSILRTK